MSKQAQIDRLDARIKELRVEFERFFNGALITPPSPLRDRIQVELRRLREDASLSFADGFRLTQMEARFNSYCELFNRRLRDHEEGRRPTTVAAPSERGLDPSAGVVVGEEATPEAVEALYTGLCRGEQAPRFDMDSFRSYLDRQAAAIRDKTGCREVSFRLVEEEGRTKLKARPLAAS